MIVNIEILYDRETVRDRLLNDGWQLRDESFGSLSASHPHVTSEREARRRLHGLGLLTSGALRVEFPMRKHVTANA